MQIALHLFSINSSPKKYESCDNFIKINLRNEIIKITTYFIIILFFIVVGLC